MKMQPIADKINLDLPYLNVKVSDNIMSSITVYGSLEKKEEWENNIFHNSPYFIVQIVTPNSKRWYENEPEVTMELLSSRVSKKLRKYTGPIEKVITKLQHWANEIKVNFEVAKNMARKI